MHEAIKFASADPRDATAAEVMSAAFESAWAMMGSSKRLLSPKQACDARVRLARIILERVEQGERDALRLGRWAMSALNTGGRPAVRQYL